jgi:hypothetical protein
VNGEGYRMGEMERIALANANTDLRSDLLSARQEIEALRAEVDQLNGALWKIREISDWEARRER